METVRLLKLILQQNRRVAIIFGIAFLLVCLLAVSLLLSRTPDGNTTQTPVQLNQPGLLPTGMTRLQKTQIGKTTAEEVENSMAILKKEQRSDGRTKYIAKSSVPLRQDEVFTQNGVVVLESTSVYTDSFGPLPKVTNFIAQFGNPAEVIDHNALYGWSSSLYIFDEKGFMLIANQNTGEVYEIIRFKPTLVENLKTLYPEYFRKAKDPKEIHAE
jgi:hypothetical protein